MSKSVWSEVAINNFRCEYNYECEDSRIYIRSMDLNDALSRIERLEKLLRKKNICPDCEKRIKYPDSEFGGYYRKEDDCACDNE